MFLHVGNNKNIRERDIIGIFDTDNATSGSVITKKYLALAEKRGEVEMAGEDVPKSFILYRTPAEPQKRRSAPRESKDGQKYKICFSVLSTASLVGRIGNIEK